MAFRFALVVFFSRYLFDRFEEFVVAAKLPSARENRDVSSQMRENERRKKGEGKGGKKNTEKTEFTFAVYTRPVSPRNVYFFCKPTR